MPNNLQVHHSLPQKYEAIFQDAGINIHETQYLEGVHKLIHPQITNMWQGWERALGHAPTIQEVVDFAKVVEEAFGHMFWGK